MLNLNFSCRLNPTKKLIILFKDTVSHVNSGDVDFLRHFLTTATRAPVVTAEPDAQ